MDYNLFGLLFAALAYWILGRSAAKRKKQRQAQQGEPAQPQPASTDDPTLDEALAEIRRALGMDAPEPEPVPVSRPPAEPKPEPQTAFEAARVKTSDEFHRVETGRPDSERAFEARPKFEEANARMEKAFEARQPLSSMKTRLQKEVGIPSTLKDKSRFSEDAFEMGLDVFRDPLADHDHRDRPEPGTVAVRLPSGRLQTREALREAFVLKEIVGPPRSMKRSIRG